MQGTHRRGLRPVCRRQGKALERPGRPLRTQGNAKHPSRRVPWSPHRTPGRAWTSDTPWGRGVTFRIIPRQNNGQLRSRGRSGRGAPGLVGEGAALRIRRRRSPGRRLQHGWGERRWSRAFRLAEGRPTSCTAVDLVRILKKQRQAVGRQGFAVQGDVMSGGPRPFVSLHATCRARGRALDEGNVRNAVEPAEGKHCSAAASLLPHVQTKNSIELEEETA
jgi:hypothetical protein